MVEYWKKGKLGLEAEKAFLQKNYNSTHYSNIPLFQYSNF